MGSQRVLGPQEPLINKIRDRFLMDVFLKVEKKYSMEAVKERIKTAKLKLLEEKRFSQIDVIADVDPY